MQIAIDLTFIIYMSQIKQLLGNMFLNTNFHMVAKTFQLRKKETFLLQSQVKNQI